MADSSDHPKVLFPPPLVFLGYFLGALAVNWAVPLPIPWAGPFRILGVALGTAGVGMVGWAFSLMMRAHTTPDVNRPTTALVTTGSYRFTRNPIYLGFLSIYLGATLWFGTLWGILLSPFLIAAVIRSVIKPEEVYLEAKFPDTYKEYKSHVRQWL